MSPVASLAVIPLSPVACDSAFCRQSGVLWATIIVKATFQLVHGEVARLATPLGLVRHDRPNPSGGSLEQANETAPHVPGAGVLLTGHAHASNGRAVPCSSVRLGVARERALVDKTLHVFGSRASAAPSTVTPFQKMPLVYERAFGGAGVWENPIGTGGPGSRALPNIVDPKDPRRVAGFGPIAGGWAPRRALLGAAAPGVLEQAIFESPPGFDWRYFQAAPADQQTDAFRGDEWIVLDGMHPTLARVQTRLPQAKAQARRVSAAAGAAEQTVELRADMLVIDADAMLASLIWRGRFQVDSLDALRWIRVYAGVELPGRPIEWPRVGARTGKAVTPVSMPVAGQAGAKSDFTGETQDIDLSAIFGGSMPFDSNRESALPPPSRAPTAAPFATGTAVVDLRAIFGQAVPFAELAATTELAALVHGADTGPMATVAAMPALDPPALPFAPGSAFAPARQSVPTPAGKKPVPMATGTTDINLAEVLKSAMPYGGYSAPPSVPVAPVVTQPRAASAPTAPVVANAYLPPAVVAAPPIFVAPTAIAAPPVLAIPSVVAPLPHVMTAQPVVIAPPLLSVAAPPVVIAPSPAAAPRAVPVSLGAPPQMAPAPAMLIAPAPLAPATTGPAPSADSIGLRDTVLERLRTGESLQGLRLVGADLRDIDFRGASLIGLDLQKANLMRAKLVDARLNDARLAGADLTGADLSGADLGRADLSRAVVTNAHFNHAILVGSRLCDARGQGASFDHARMAQADLQGAALEDASFNEIDAPESIWDKATLNGARFLGAKLRGASFQRATLDKTSFLEAELVSANFQRATGTSTDLRAARMEAADLRQAQLPNAILDDAELRDVSATKADFSGARFFRTDLTSANLRAAKLNGADFSHAKLDGADFRDAETQGIKIDPAAARLAKIRLSR